MANKAICCILSNAYKYNTLEQKGASKEKHVMLFLEYINGWHKGVCVEA
jgi:hypothetical protein